MRFGQSAQTSEPQEAEMEPLESTYEMVKVADLNVHPDNARKGNIGRIEESIRVNGFYGAVIAQRSTKRIIAGNHRFMAATNLGMTELPVLWVDVDDNEARRILLADNRSNDLASYDDAMLADLLRAAQDTTGLEGTGFDEVDLQDLLMALEPQISLEDLANEWAGPKPGIDDGKTTITIVVEEEVGSELKDYLKEVGDDTVAIKNLLAKR